MIKSVNSAIYDALSGAEAIIYAISTLEIRPNNLGYFIRTTYFRKNQVGNEEIGFQTEDIRIAAFEEVYTTQEVDAIFESLKDVIGELPFTEMIATGIELALLQFLNTNVKFGIPANSGGWEIVS